MSGEKINMEPFERDCLSDGPQLPALVAAQSLAENTDRLTTTSIFHILMLNKK